MGNILKRGKDEDPDSAWQEQNREMERNPAYKFANFIKGGKLIDAYRKRGVVGVQEIARNEIPPFLYNGGKGGTITKLDYVKWTRRKQAKRTGSTVWETKTDEELLAEFELAEQNSLNKVADKHEACWDLEKRGGVGETPIHLLYLTDSPEHYEVAKIVINMFPKLALDFYEADEYYGESSLHLAVVYGDLESVRLLVSNGADVNQRATGRFFLPEDQKNGIKAQTTYDGFAYYGEYPIAFATWFGWMDIYDYLIDNGADPNLQDSFGNTSMHMAVIADQPEMYKYMLKHHKKPAKIDIRNKANLTPLTLASRLGRHKIFKEILELNSIEFWRYSNVTCSAYPLTEIDSISPSGETNYNSALMIVINGEEDDHLEMLEGGVMRQLLDDKWKTFARRRFFERLILTFIYLSLISVAIYLRPASGLLDYNEPKDAIRFTCEIIVCLFTVGYIVLEVVEIGSQGVIGFIKNCRHAPAHTVFLLSCVIILACIPFRFLHLQQVEDILLILAVPGSWFFLLFFARSVPLTGPFVTMIYKMCTGDLFRFGLIYLIFLIGFTQGFYFLFRDINQESFSSLPTTIMTLFQMTLGEFKYHDFDLTRYALLTKLVFAVFMILVPILLLNMLIAMMGNTYQSVIIKSEKEWRKQWAKIVVVLERGFSKKKLQEFHREYSIKLAGPSPEDPSIKEEIRALVVIKTSPKTKARQRKIAVGNWKKLGKEIIIQLKEQKRSGKLGPLKLHKVARKQSTLAGSQHNSDDDDDKKFSNITAQLAWEKDIDLTKGQAFLKDPAVIENTPNSFDNTDSKLGGNKKTTESPAKKTATETPTPPPTIPNGNPLRPIRKYVKKPNGTPKTSPKVQKQFQFNRVSPLPVYKIDTEEDGDIETSLREGFSPVTQRAINPDVKYESVLQSSQIVEEEEIEQVVMKADDGYVSHASHDTSHDFRSPPVHDGRTRPGSADSRAKYDQWVDELIETSPGSSPGKQSIDSPDSKHSKGKKHRKKDKKEKKDKSKGKDNKTDGSIKTKESSKSKGGKTPTSDDVLLVDDSDLDDESVL